MSLEAMQLYEEIKEYLIVGKYEYELKKDAPNEIQEKFEKFQEIATFDTENKESTQK